MDVLLLASLTRIRACACVPQDEILALALWHTPRGKWWPVEVRTALGFSLLAMHLFFACSPACPTD